MVEEQSDAPVTVLFSDIEGSTDLQSRLGDARARDLMRRHEAAVREALAAHGGHEVKTTGDGFLATFTSTRRALEGAIAIQQASDEVRVRIGLHAGEVIYEGDDIHGAAVSAASRVMNQAQGGEILVSDLVKQLAGAAGVRFKERGRVQLKGLDGQWLLHEVEWQDEGASPLTPAPGTTAAPGLVGREVESALLRSAIDDAIRGRGRLVLLAGEPGIGKTTLATAATDYAAQRGARVLWGACWEGEGAPAFWPWLQAIRAYAAERTDDELAVDIGPDGPELCRLLPELSTRLPPMAPPPELEPEQARFRQFDAIASCVARAAARQPLAVVLDDLHWADESSMRLLIFVAGQLTTNPVAIIGTYRDTEVRNDHPLASLMHDASRRGQLLPVTGLDPADVGRLMASTAGAELRAELAAAVHRQTAGNPLFVGEMTRLLAAQNALDRDDVSVGVPQGVREVIERRMARLPQRCIDVLTMAAVAGEEFGLDVVARAAEVPIAEVVGFLEVACEAGVARAAGTGRYRFAHALFREALYEGQGMIARAGLHLQVANALEHRRDDGGDVTPAELAHHFVLAALTGEIEKAVRYTLLAGQAASASLAYTEAVGHYVRALEVLDLAPHPTESERSELLLELSGARWRSGDRDGARREIDRSIAIARSSGRGDVLARAALGLHRLGGASGSRQNDRLDLLAEARIALGDVETSLRAQVLAALAKETYHTWLHSAQALEGSEMAAEAVAIARRLDDRHVLVEALAAQHDILWFAGQEQRRLGVALELERAATEVGDREQATEAVLLQGVALLELADPTAVPRVQTFVAQAEELAQPRFAYLAATRRVTLATICGDFDAADAALEDAAAIAAVHGEPDHINVSAAQTHALGTLRGERASSLELSRLAYRSNEAFGRVIAAHQTFAFIEEGDVDRARAAFRQIDLSFVEERLMNYGWLYETAVISDAAVALNETSVMSHLIEQMRPFRDICIVVGGAVSFYGHTAHYIGQLHQALGQHDEASACFEQALVAYGALGATAWAERTHAAMGADAAAGEVHNEMRREGRSWTFTYAGAAVTVRESKGVRDLAALLAAPGRDMAAADLMAQGDIAESGADAVLDDRARREFRARLTELDDDLGEAERDNDLERISQVKAERDTLAHELAAALGLGGRGRKLGDPAERARKAVAARIRDAIEKVATQHTELGQHLRASIRTGTFCTYAPPSTTTWRVTNDTAR